MDKFVENVEVCLVTAVLLAAAALVVYLIATALAAGNLMLAFGLLVASTIVGLSIVDICEYDNNNNNTED